uniref:Uncharacterized protein n=1 Tax=Bracon brevicornis TaxID=1563983 RepID=A0A6V7JG71_9HYME
MNSSEKTSTGVDLPTNKENEDNLEDFTLQRQDVFLGAQLFAMQSFSVIKALKNHLEGRVVLSHYKTRRVLDRNSRKIIVDVVMKAAMKITRKLTNECFNTLAKKTVEVFKNERIAVYYQPPIPKSASKSKKSIPSKGKLPSKYRNMMKKLKRYEAERPTKKAVIVDASAEASEAWLQDHVTP